MRDFMAEKLLSFLFLPSILGPSNATSKISYAGARSAEVAIAFSPAGARGA
jgi:hypothetical protein